MAHEKIMQALLSIALVALTATAAWAQKECLLEGREYPENAMVCSGGLVLNCSNGIWQNNDGGRCNAQSGSYVGPLRPFQERNDEQIPEYYKEKYPNLNLP